MLRESTIAGNRVTFSATNPPVIATASSNAVAGTYSLTIGKLATGTVARSTAAIGSEIVSSDKLADINFPTAVTAGTFTINGVAITIDDVTAESLDDVLNEINSSGAGVTASLASVGGRLRLALTANSPGGPVQLGSAGDTSNFLSATKVLAAPKSGDTVTGTGNLGATRTGNPLSQASLAVPVSGTGTLTINGVEVEYDADQDSLSTIVNRINAAGAGVTASYDTVNDRFVLQNRQTGSVTIGLSDTGNLLAGLGVANPAAQSLGSNAEYSLDGGVTTRYSASNTITDAVAGVTLTLTGASADPVSFTVAPDIDSAVDAIKKFVEQYNSTASFIREKMSYNADTKKAGVLLSDSGVRGLDRALRSFITRDAVNVDGAFKRLSDVGITFGAIGSELGSTNTLKVDETKLRAALDKNAPAVFQMFGASTTTATLATSGDVASVTGTPTNVVNAGHYDITSDGNGLLTATFTDANGIVGAPTSVSLAAGSFTTTLIPGMEIHAAIAFTGASARIDVAYQSGVFASLDQYLSGAQKDEGILKLGVDTADNQIKQVDKSIERLETRLADRERRLLAQFTRMERLLAQMQAQSNALASQLAGLTNQSNQSN
jgi:flagellar hook-associated protein 2